VELKNQGDSNVRINKRNWQQIVRGVKQKKGVFGNPFDIFNKGVGKENFKRGSRNDSPTVRKRTTG